MVQYTIHKAKTHLSKILESVVQGEEIIIAKGNNPIAVIKKYEPPRKQRKGEQWKGKVQLSDDFDDFGPELQDMFDMNK